MSHANYLNLRLELSHEVFEDANAAFNEEYLQVCDTVPVDERVVLKNALQGIKPKEPSTEDIEDDTPAVEQSKKNSPESVRKVYKEIAKRSHPDALIGSPKQEADRKASLFREAQRAVDDTNLLDLLKIAEELDIQLDKDIEEYTQILQENIKTLKKEVKMIKGTPMWQWYHAKTHEEKHDIMLAYMQYMYESYK